MKYCKDDLCEIKDTNEEVHCLTDPSIQIKTGYNTKTFNTTA